MPLILTSGEAGVGKSTQHASLCSIYGKDAIYLCMEVKDKKLLQWKDVNTLQIIHYNEMFEEDAVKTIEVLESTIRDIIKSNKYKYVILDGISDIRKFAQKEWIHKDNLIRMRDGKSPRTMISGDNLGAWSAINQRVIGILEPLINWSNITGNHVLFTAQMKDSYLNNQKVGRAIAAGDWIEFDVDVKCNLYRDLDGNYMATFTKLPGWATVKEENVPLMKEGYIGLLAERGLL